MPTTASGFGDNKAYRELYNRTLSELIDDDTALLSRDELVDGLIDETIAVIGATIYAVHLASCS
jgi:hypothetical protein